MTKEKLYDMLIWRITHDINEMINLHRRYIKNPFCTKFDKSEISFISKNFLLELLICTNSCDKIENIKNKFKDLHLYSIIYFTSLCYFWKYKNENTHIIPKDLIFNCLENANKSDYQIMYDKLLDVKVNY